MKPSCFMNAQLETRMKETVKGYLLCWKVSKNSIFTNHFHRKLDNIFQDFSRCVNIYLPFYVLRSNILGQIHYVGTNRRDTFHISINAIHTLTPRSCSECLCLALTHPNVHHMSRHMTLSQANAAMNPK